MSNWMVRGSKTLPFLLPLALLLTSGCGDDSNRVGVSGTVTVDGEPLEQGSVAFIGENGSAVAAGPVRNGSYTLRQTANAEGIEPGQYKVRIESWKVQPGEPQDDGTFAAGEAAIPEKYMDAEKSGLTATVPDGNYDFDLKSAG